VDRKHSVLNGNLGKVFDYSGVLGGMTPYTAEFCCAHEGDATKILASITGLNA
jgi:hypothetical protein